MQEKTKYRKRHKSQHLLYSSRERRTLTRTILRWYSREGRSLPWRLPTGQAGNIMDQYRVLVSEVMLQQTQVHRVLEKYPKFLRRFPTLKRLAIAKQRDVVIAWQGMGYNNRAVRLHRLARIVMSSYGGTLPRSLEDLIALPGIGKYTAHALLASAFRKNVPVVDINVQRLFSRIFWRMKTTADIKPVNEIWELAGKLVPSKRVYDWNQALMDLGATVCTARTPQCTACPVAAFCRSQGTIKEMIRSSRQKERSRDGIPNRIYRGRIVETLRQHHGRKKLHADAVGRTIHPQYSTKHRPWLESLLIKLEKDGLIRRARIGRWNERRIALA